jgi:hypothetical protein
MFNLMKVDVNKKISFSGKVLIVLFLFFAAACEDLTDSLSPRDNIADTWKCAETSTSGSDSFLVEIVADNASTTGIQIYNFDNLGDNLAVKATVNSFSISIPSQSVDGFTISGSGTISSDYKKITLKYTVNDGGDTQSYNATLTKP